MHKIEKNTIYNISEEDVQRQTTRQIDDQTVKKQNFHRTIALEAGPINQVESECF